MEKTDQLKAQIRKEAKVIKSDNVVSVRWHGSILVYEPRAETIRRLIGALFGSLVQVELLKIAKGE